MISISELDNMTSTSKSDKVPSNICSIIKLIYKNKLSADYENINKLYIPSEGYIYCLHNEIMNYYGSDVYKLGKNE